MAPTVAVFSLGGAPGVTSFAVALASVWPGPDGAVLVEADVSGGDVAAWWGLRAEPGTVDLAAALRPRSSGAAEPAPAAPADHAQELPGGVPVCVAPSAPERAAATVGLLAGHRMADGGTGPAAVLDLGRMAPGSAAVRLAVAADAAVLLVRHDLAQLRRAKETAAVLSDGIGTLGLGVVGGGRGGDGELAGAVGLPVWARLPHDPRGAAFVRGDRSARRPHRLPLLRAAAELAGRPEVSGSGGGASAAPPLAPGRTD